MAMTVKQIKDALSKWPDDAICTGWYNDTENLIIVGVNEPFTRVPGPVIWMATDKSAE